MKNNISNVLKTESKVIAYVVICLVIIVLGISYALFFEVKGNEKNQIVKAGTLEFTYANGSQVTSDTNSDCFIPMSNEEALTHSECEYKISITNTGTLPGNYNIKLSSESIENPLALSKLKIILKKEGQTVEGYPKVGTTTSLVENEKIEAGSVINYSVQVYVDKGLITADDDEKNISIKINGSAVVNSEEVNPDGSILATDYITAISKKDTTNLIADDTNEANIRYVGANPNNYIDIGDRDGNGKPILWRVIGVMNNITNFDNGEKVERLVKIRRAESIGQYSWNSSDASQNDGWGINEWSEADLMKLLNPGYEENQDMDPEKNTITVNNSLYWTKGSGNCYNAGRYGYTSCDFTSSGLSEEARRKIAKVRWNTGTAGEEYDENKITAKYMYEGERSTHNGKEICENAGGGGYCNDTVLRTTTWDGYVGLIYPSDYGYAVGGEVRDTCLGKSMKSYNTEECRTNDWLKPSWLHSWTMTPAPISNKSNHTFYIYYGGDVSVYNTCDPFYIFPTAYLKSSFKILENLHPELEYGTIDNPFIVR